MRSHVFFLAWIIGLSSWSAPALAQSTTEPRGGDEFVVPNWWMGMWMREKGPNEFGINAMLSLDPATVGNRGYKEIFQVGEAFEGKPLIDHQHPHDFLMQLSTSWRRSIGASS